MPAEGKLLEQSKAITLADFLAVKDGGGCLMVAIVEFANSHDGTVDLDGEKNNYSALDCNTKLLTALTFRLCVKCYRQYYKEQYTPIFWL